AKRYLHGPLVDQVLAQEDTSVSINSSGRVLWLLADDQGTTWAIARNNGAMQGTYNYDSYGMPLPGNDMTKKRYLYTGREYDNDTKLQYNRARWYDPAVGGWLSEDPIGFGGGDYNLQRYVGNSPVNGTDPSGLWNFVRWLYTGDGDASDEIYNAAMQAAG